MKNVMVFGGVLGHAIVGTWPAFAAVVRNQPISWFVVALHTLGPGVITVSAAALAFLLHSPPQVLQIVEQVDECGRRQLA
jgi:hypothetical protein